jgi:hypothetical protein
MTVAPQPLIDDIEAGCCLPFIGAGFSLNAALTEGVMPDWQALARHLAAAAGVAGDIDGPDAAAAYERQFGRVHLIEAIRRALRPADARPGAAHLAFVQLPFDTIYTTNFDLLLEDALRLQSKPYRALVGELQLPFHAGKLTTNLVKMHGGIGHEEHIVVTRRDYDGFLTRYPIVATHLSAMLITRTPLFIGYRRTDTDYLNIEGVVRSRLGEFTRMPYLLQFDVSPAYIEDALADGLHIVNIPTLGRTRDDALADFFTQIQRELDARAGVSLRAAEPRLFEAVPHDTLDATYRSDAATDVLEGSSSLCFVMMPINPSTDNLYRTVILPAVAEVGLSARRIYEMHVQEPTTITEWIRAAIRESRACIADVSDASPSVLYELGLALTLGKSVVLLARRGTTLPADIAGLQYVSYDGTDPADALGPVLRALHFVLETDRLGEAESLISAGMFRPAISVLSVQVEHTLRRLATSTS